MCWVETDFANYSSFGPSGHIRLFTPEADMEDLEIPDGVFPILERVSMSTVVHGDKSRMFLSGGNSDNLMVTEQRYVLRNFISPVSLELAVTPTPASHQVGLELVAAAGGLTGECIFYLRWYDTLHDRRSPFSGPSPVMTLDGAHAVKFYNVPSRPSPDDYTVDQIEVWVWRNGITDSQGRPDIRRIASRDTGAPIITITEEVEGLAETEQALQKMPRCRFNATYHAREWFAGDERHPERLYFSPIDRYDEFTGLYINTLNGEAIVGIVNVRDSLVVLCAESSYVVIGYSASDLGMDVLEPQLGCLTHFGVAKIGRLAIIPTHQGFAICNGTSMKLLPGDYQKLWTELVMRNRNNFEMGFGINDRVAGVYKFHEESVDFPLPGVPNFANGRYWVLDYGKNAIDSEITVEPKLSFDDHSQRPKCAAMLQVPGGKAGACFTAHFNTDFEGFIAKENQWGAGDVQGYIDVVIAPAMIVAESGGGPWDGLTLHEAWFYAYGFRINPDPEVIADVRIQNGNEFCVFPAQTGQGIILAAFIHTEEFLLNLPASSDGKTNMSLFLQPIRQDGPPGPSLVLYFPQTQMLPSQSLIGEGFAPIISVRNPLGLVYRGHGMSVSPGKKYQHIMVVEE